MQTLRTKRRIASPGRIDQPNDAFVLAACVQGRKIGANKFSGKEATNTGKNPPGSMGSGFRRCGGKAILVYS
jgi:hypothetical protein